MTAYVKVLTNGEIEYTANGKKYLIHTHADGEGVVIRALDPLTVDIMATNIVRVRAR